MTMLALNKEEAQVRKLKVEVLRETMIKTMNFDKSQLQNRLKWKMQKELHMMVETFYAEKAKDINKQVEEALERELSKFPAVTPCSSINLASEPPAKQGRG